MHRDVLIELGCEELPPGSLKVFQQSFAESMSQQLQASQFAFGQVHAYASPRRLALHICDVAVEQADKTITRRGPNVRIAFDDQDKPTPAALGFARSCGTTVDALQRVVEGNETFISATITELGQPLPRLLPAMVEKALLSLPIAKMMRWGEGHISFVRPVHWLLILLGEEVVAGQVLGLEAGRLTYGHRFHHPQSLEVPTPAAYISLLAEQGYVIADFEQRQQGIVDDLQQAATQLGGRCLMMPTLVETVTAIVEWPVVLTVPFDKQFLSLPREVLMTSMATHQKCFLVEDIAGQIMPYCLVVANIASSQPQRVIDGNARVIHARLSDAAFFYQQDGQQPLDTLRPRLAQVIFQEKLGTLADKTTRIQALMNVLADQMTLDQTQAIRAAALSKCSLLTEMVGEFPELQDVMGEVYARHDGEPSSVALALKEQYLPRFSGDDLPQSPLGKALALADRIDTLTGIIGIGLKPTGEKDPFQLRRLALGVIRILMTTDLDCQWLIAQAIKQYDNTKWHPETSAAVMQFIHDRLTIYLRQQEQVSVDRIHATLARQPNVFADLLARLRSLKTFLADEQGGEVVRIAKRVSHMLKQRPSTLPEVNPALFEASQEVILFEGLQSLAQQQTQSDYQAYLQACLALVSKIDLFFEGVMIQADDQDLRLNRLALLQQLDSNINWVVSFNELQGGTTI